MRILCCFILAVSLPAVGQDYFPDEPHIYVEGSARVTLEPEVLVISGEIESRNKKSALAMKSVKEKSAALLQVGIEHGLKREDIRASVPSIRPDYRHVDGERVFKGYEANRDIEITVEDLETYHVLLASVVESEAVESLKAHFSVRDAEEAMNEAQLLALDDAKARAARIAERSGRTLGSIYSVSEFDLRGWEPSMLIPARQLAKPEATVALKRVAVTGSSYGGQEPLFEPEQLEAQAVVYVIYLLAEE